MGSHQSLRSVSSGAAKTQQLTANIREPLQSTLTSRKFDEIEENRTTGGQTSTNSPLHGQSTAKKICSFCNKELGNAKGLRNHRMRQHADKLLHECKFCSKKFFEPSELTAHLRSHTNVKRFTCGQCHQNYSRSDSLGHHMRLHTGEKPYQCEVCLRRFNHKSNYRKHVPLHKQYVPQGSN